MKLERRTALATAGVVTLVVLAGAGAMAASFGILDSTDGKPAGKLSPISAELSGSGATDGTNSPTPRVTTVYVDEVVRVPIAGGSAPTTASVSTDSSAGVKPAPGVPSTPAVSVSDEDRSDDRGAGESHESEAEDAHESGHEGAEEDD
ncbi:MAG: hypothetical protein HYR89_09305 [Actinobacteria bacterium]|nr:hypothetical protein [Actinomycetota bacterium]